ncbi:hypothetical protein [Caulobacter sp. BK020]|uniref:hypothetical protein n=1 Tax=Caulobacter sp. BK020 TaxID=2512117 RepID=UPI00104BB875|nr:hypothetical protein [Caulobacter sp. BK020]TCS14539.1 hypothetical protein EV278_107188 [Caulobacter sp. BK020]
MTKACRAPVRAAVGDAFTDDEIDALLERVVQRKKAKAAAKVSLSEGGAWKEAAAEIARDELKASLIEQRTRIFAERAKLRRRAQLSAMEGSPARKLLAFIEGDETQGFGNSFSIDAQGRALETELLAGIERGLRKNGLWDRIANALDQQDPQFEEAVATEMARLNGGRETPTGDEDAVKAAEIFNGAIERGRQMQNDEGAWIGQLDGYVARQSHDALKVAGGFWGGVGSIKTAIRKGGLAAMKSEAAQKAFQRWRDTIAPLLHERTFADLGLTDRGLTGVAAREEMLRGVWWNIVTGKHEIMAGADDLGDFTPPASLARKVSAERVLHFRDAKSWLAYHREFGRGSLFSAIVGDVRRAARNTALMKGFGPAPEAAFKAEVERGLADARATHDAVEGKAFLAKRMEQAFEQIDGRADAPENVRLAMIGQMIRGHESISKLGGMVLSAFADVPVATQALARVGVDWLAGYDGILRGISRLDGPQAREVAELMDVGARAASGRLSTRLAAKDGPLGWIGWGQRFNMKISGFEWWNDGLRAGVATILSKHLGQSADLAFDALPIGTRETFERYGIDAAGWDRLRAGAAQQEGVGRIITADAAGDDADLALRFRALTQETLDNATSEARARERRMIGAGTRRGTIAGEAIRLYTQFWSFPQTFIQRSLIPAAKGYAGQKPAALLAHLILSTTLFGYVSMQAKQMAKGRTPRPLSPEAFMAAMLQGGGLGIYGDFLFGDFNRFGGSPLSTLGGPAIGDLESAMKLWSALRSGEDVGAEAFQFAKANTPFINTWWTKAALDYVLLWRVQEALNPGWAARYQKRVEDQTGSEFWLAPTDAVR